ncbi:MAG: hypothetical protein PVF28_03470 [Thioalkalispiraceae bacterium]|jgi:lysophospholipase L1-like esterase
MGNSKSKSIFERHPKKTTAIIIFIIVIGMDILAAQVLSAVGLYRPQFKIERYYRIKHDIFHHTLAPSIAHSEAQWGPIGYRVNTNSLGFKDSSNRAIKLNADKHRIIFLGDSFTEGVGYAYDETFVGLIDKKLRDNEIAVLNAAVTSYSPIIYLRKTEYLLKDLGLDFDQMIVLIDISDIQDEALYYTYDKDGNVVDAATSRRNELDERIKRFITEETILLSNLRIYIRKLKKSNKEFNQKSMEDALNVHRGLWTHDPAAYDDYGKKGVQLALERMSKLSTLLKQHKIKLTVVVYPWPDQIVYGDPDSRQVNIWRDWAKKNAVDFVNLFPAFLQEGEAKDVIRKYYILGDVHWNKAGHELVANRLLKHLAKQ